MKAICIVIVLILLLCSAQEEFWDIVKSRADELNIFKNQTIIPAFLEKTYENFKKFSEELTETVIKQTNIKDTIEATLSLIKDVKTFSRAPDAFTLVHINLERISPVIFRRMIRAHGGAYELRHNYVIAYWVHNSSCWERYGADDVAMLRNYFPESVVRIFFNPNSWDSLVSSPTHDAMAVRNAVDAGGNIRIDRIIYQLDRELLQTSSGYAEEKGSSVLSVDVNVGAREGRGASEGEGGTDDSVDVPEQTQRTPTYWAVSTSVAWIGDLAKVLQRWSQPPLRDVDFIGASCGGKTKAPRGAQSIELNFGFGFTFKFGIDPTSDGNKDKNKNDRNLEKREPLRGESTASGHRPRVADDADGSSENCQSSAINISGIDDICIPDIARYSTRLLYLLTQGYNDSGVASAAEKPQAGSCNSNSDGYQHQSLSNCCGAHDCALRLAKANGLSTADILDVGAKERLLAVDFISQEEGSQPETPVVDDAEDGVYNGSVRRCISASAKSQTLRTTVEEFKAVRQRYHDEAAEPTVFPPRAGVLFRNLECDSDRICEA